VPDLGTLSGFCQPFRNCDENSVGVVERWSSEGHVIQMEGSKHTKVLNYRLTVLGQN
jgi:hypothetical protein